MDELVLILENIRKLIDKMSEDEVANFLDQDPEEILPCGSDHFEDLIAGAKEALGEWLVGGYRLYEGS